MIYCVRGLCRILDERRKRDGERLVMPEILAKAKKFLPAWECRLRRSNVTGRRASDIGLLQHLLFLCPIWVPSETVGTR